MKADPTLRLRAIGCDGPIVIGTDILLPDQLDAYVVEYRLGWRTRLKIMLTGRISVWRTK